MERLGRERVVSMDKLVALYMQAREVVGLCWDVVYTKMIFEGVERFGHRAERCKGRGSV